MKYDLARSWFIAALAALILSAFAFPLNQKSSSPKSPANVYNLLGWPQATKININNTSAWYHANGEQERGYDISGLTYPRGTATAVYAAGILWGGKFRDGTTPVIRVNGQVYNNGTIPGAIIGIRTGIAEDPNSPDVRIWRIRQDYAAGDLTEDAAEINLVSRGQVTQAMIDSVRSQYARDWREWPWQKGAPFYDNGYRDAGGVVRGANNGVLDWGEDANRNGVADIGEDTNANGVLDGETPGLAGADQVVWFVCNDIGVAQPWSCPTSGIEEQGTIWAYSRAGAVQDIIFKRFRLIYKGLSTTPDTARIDSMYIAQYSDVDLGSYADDFVGCDTVLNLSYVYNANPTDNLYSLFGLPPPALGYDLLQGPLVRTGEPGDTAVFNMQWVLGAKNRPLTAFIYFAAGGLYAHPPFNYSGAIEWYQMLRGFPPRPPGAPPFINPVTGEPTYFWLSGDPVTGAGWRDGFVDLPGDRQIFMTSGPFTMAVGDTQEIIVAVVGGIGTSNLESVTEMRTTSVVAQRMYDALFTITPPAFSVKVSYPTLAQASVTVVADGKPAKAIAINTTLKRQDRSVIAALPLFDDGFHDDGVANDGLFANQITLNGELRGVYLEATSTDDQNRSFPWGRVVDRIPIAGQLDLSRFTIFQDNLNGDGIANPGETIRYGLTVTNQTGFVLQELRIRPSGELAGRVRSVGSLAPGSSDSMIYDPVNPASYFSIKIPQTITSAILRFAVSISDSNNNNWLDTVDVPVARWPHGLDTVNIQRTSGGVLGSFDILIVDPKALQKHLYVVRSVDTIASKNPKITLKDSTDGRVLLLSQPLPDAVGFDAPVTDGFKILRGSVAFDTVAGMKSYSWKYLSGPSPWTSTRANGFQLEGFGGAIGKAYGKWFSSSSVTIDKLKSVRIKLASTDSSGNPRDPADTLLSFGYRYLRRASYAPARPEFAPFIVNLGPGFAYQDFRKTVPFAAYDDETNPPRRLAVGFLENNVLNGLVDGKYWPALYSPIPPTPPRNTDTTGAYEFFFIFDMPYSENLVSDLRKDIYSTRLAIMWWGTPGRSTSSFAAGGEFFIQAAHPFTPADVWTFQPQFEQIVPQEYVLFQNYPNPFNPNTTIDFSLPFDSRVTLKIYNLLGQEVKTLLDEIQTARNKRVQWDGSNNAGNSVASGVYFYRLEAASLTAPRQGFSEVKKMLLVR